MKLGALPYQDLIALQEKGFLSGFSESSFQPASVDLSLTDEIYRLRGAILPKLGEDFRSLLKAAGRFKHNIAEPLEPGISYLCRIAESVRLPKNLYGYANPKSSTGRNDIQVRIVAPGVPRFDSLPYGFKGELWVLISSKHFLVKLTAGDRVSQIRIFNKDTRFNEKEIKNFYNRYPLLCRPIGRPFRYEELKVKDRDGSLILTVDFRSSAIVGYRARPAAQAPILIFSRFGHRWSDFFEEIERPKEGYLTLEMGKFYIFYTYERVRVPFNLAAEMVAMDERSGEFRSHYAGFIDPGWGIGPQGRGRGWQLVLEIRPFDDNLIVRHGQPICKLRYERLQSVPKMIYGQTDSHYVCQQGAMLSKHFRL